VISRRLRSMAFGLGVVALAGVTALPPTHLRAASLHDTIRDAQRKVVKIYGAGGVSELEAYQTGVVISPEGHVLTVQSYVLDTDDLAVVLDDGRKFEAELLGSDPVRELAVLKLPIKDEALPYFDLAAAPEAAPGERVMALSNLFNIAGGDEPVSVLQGVVTALAPLEARRGAFESSFHGRVYIVDAAANNPGAAGGALVNWRGEFLGLLGKELRSRSTGAWLHYAVPVDQFLAAVETMRSGRSLDAGEAPESAPAEPLRLSDVGLVLVPDVLPRTPPYIDAVLPKSAAARAGLKPDDLVVFVEGEATASCSAVVEAIAKRERFDAVRVSVLRNGELVEASLEAESDAIDGHTGDRGTEGVKQAPKESVDSDATEGE
jgi:S1-C subfamily serine protease